MAKNREAAAEYAKVKQLQSQENEDLLLKISGPPSKPTIQ